MATNREMLDDFANWKDRLIEIATPVFCAFILLVNPEYEFMNVFPILPPNENLGYKFIQVESELAPPLFTLESAVKYGTDLIDRGFDIVVYSYKEGILSTVLSNYDMPKMPDIQIEPYVWRKGGSRSVRNNEMQILRSAGMKVTDIANKFGVTRALVYQVTKNA
jgi:hypothetical protein